ncbi:allantoinase AllB [Deinococcus alpinitundrae]|uniref:allantoinase AllB n=1 Tax=Deinococcus alpinitundrae TaxID=468913 RepID=UPI00137B24D9|nr:allantoinase AllB [Deinococcus alpinitundrae]
MPLTVNDLCVTNARIVTPQGVVRGSVSVLGGKVVHIGPAQPARQEVDAGGKLLLPGLVDLHVHFNEPGRTDWEGWAHGSAAAAAGGVTTVVEMPLNAVPATTTARGLALKLAAAQAHSRVDFGLWGGLIRDNRADLSDLIAGGVTGFKAFMYETGDPTFPAASDGVLFTGMQALAAAGLPLLVHAENSDLIHTLMGDLQAAGRSDTPAWLDAHPPVSEVEAVARVLRLARAADCRLHIVHVSLPEAARLIVEAREGGQQVTYEVCAHHLILTDQDFLRLGNVAKCAPPLRSQADVDGLWELLLTGQIDTLASDHSPCPSELKEGNIWQSWGGINGGQLTLPLMLTEAQRRGLSVEDAAQLVARHACQNPARIAGLSSRKGAIQVGLDADLVLVDPQAVWTLQESALKSRHPWSPFIGRELVGKVERAWLRGRALYADGAVLDNVRGEWLRPVS